HQPAAAVQHGRTAKNNGALNGKDTVNVYEYSHASISHSTVSNRKNKGKVNNNDNSEHLQVPVQLIEITTSGFDNARISKQQQQSLLTGQVLMPLEEGVEIRYAYDALNRLTKETIAPISSAGYEARREYEYTLCSPPRQHAEQVLADAR
ncbi:hypothetical protein EWW49_33915, partial [Pseudomonas syringae]